MRGFSAGLKSRPQAAIWDASYPTSIIDSAAAHCICVTHIPMRQYDHRNQVLEARKEWRQHERKLVVQPDQYGGDGYI
eukprot:COSAG05_NODE_2236_length_3357_cov_5.705955_4_plen_78_part_00